MRASERERERVSTSPSRTLRILHENSHILSTEYEDTQQAHTTLRKRKDKKPKDRIEDKPQDRDEGVEIVEIEEVEEIEKIRKEGDKKDVEKIKEKEKKEEEEEEEEEEGDFSDGA